MKKVLKFYLRSSDIDYVRVIIPDFGDIMKIKNERLSAAFKDIETNATDISTQELYYMDLLIAYDFDYGCLMKDVEEEALVHKTVKGKLGVVIELNSVKMITFFCTDESIAFLKTILRKNRKTMSDAAFNNILDFLE